jgi:hypothetical protein
VQAVFPLLLKPLTKEFACKFIAKHASSTLLLKLNPEVLLPVLVDGIRNGTIFTDDVMKEGIEGALALFCNQGKEESYVKSFLYFVVPDSHLHQYATEQLLARVDQESFGVPALELLRRCRFLAAKLLGVSDIARCLYEDAVSWGRVTLFLGALLLRKQEVIEYPYTLFGDVAMKYLDHRMGHVRQYAYELLATAEPENSKQTLLERSTFFSENSEVVSADELYWWAFHCTSVHKAVPDMLVTVIQEQEGSIKKERAALGAMQACIELRTPEGIAELVAFIGKVSEDLKLFLCDSLNKRLTCGDDAYSFEMMRSGGFM